MTTPRPRLDLAERNLRNLVSNGERAGQHVIQAYRLDVVDLLVELDRLRQAARLVDPCDVAGTVAMTAGARRG